MAYHNLEPWDLTRADLNAGTIAATIAQVHGNKHAKPTDFMPDYHKRGESDELKQARIMMAKSKARHAHRKRK